MKKTGLILLIVSIVVMTGCTVQMNEANNGRFVEKTYDLADFTALDISNAFEVEVREGDYSVVLNVDERFVDDLKVDVRGDVLEIGLDRGFHFSFFEFERKLTAVVTMPRLDAVDASGATQVTLQSDMPLGEDVKFQLSGASAMTGDITAKRVTFDLSGAGSYDGKIEAETLDAEISGASEMKASGSVNEARIDASGASEFEGNSFAVKDLEAKASGASSVEVNASGDVRLDASGASDITVFGSPKVISEDSSGASSIEIRK